MTKPWKPCCSDPTARPQPCDPARWWWTAPPSLLYCAKRLAQQGIHYLDAPVTGGTEGAKAGTLTLLVGGESRALACVRPVLVAGSYAAVAEAMALGKRLDLPMDQVVEALKSGAAGSWALDHRSAGMLMGHYPLGFRLALHHKDLGIALEAAESVQLELPISRTVRQLEHDLMQQGHGDEDISALHRQFETKS